MIVVDNMVKKKKNANYFKEKPIFVRNMQRYVYIIKYLILLSSKRLHYRKSKMFKIKNDCYY